MNPPICKSRRRPNAIAFAKLIGALQSHPCSYADIAEVTGLHAVTARAYLLAMHKEGVIHVSMWEQDSRGIDRRPVFELGPGRDKPRQKVSDSERCRRYRAKKAQLSVLHALAGSHAVAQ